MPAKKKTKFSSSVLALRLKREGAKEGDVTASLIWNDPADLDLHAEIKIKGQTEHIWYGGKKGTLSGGYLDVDMNAGSKSLEPVENIFWKNPAGGQYRVYVHNINNSCGMFTQPEFQDMARAVPFKCFLKQGGKTKEFEGECKRGQNVTCFKWRQGGGGGANYIIFPPKDEKVTFKALCAEYDVPWVVGNGYYAVARREKIQATKEMLLQDIDNDEYTVGADECREKLGWEAGELKKGPKDILAGHRLFVQSTSYNRVIKPGTHVLFEVTEEQYKKYRKAYSTKWKKETHTQGTGGGKAKPKAKAPQKKQTPKKKSAKKTAAKRKAPAAKAKPAKKQKKQKGKTYLECSGTKFWEIKITGKTTTVRYGKIGKDGSNQVKEHADKAAAEKFVAKMTKAKEKKGYAAP